MRALLLALLVAAPAVAQINTERMRRSFDNDTLVVAIDASAAVSRGNTDFLQIGLGGRADARVWGNDQLFIVGRLDLAQTAGDAFLDRSFLHARHNTPLGPSLVWETFAQIERNGPQRLRARTLVGGGVRFEAVNRDSVGLAFGVTPMYEYEVLDPELGDATSVVRVSSYVAGRLRLGGATLTSTTYVQPRPDVPADLRVLSQAAISVPLTRSIRLTVRSDVRLDNRPPPGVERLDVRVENGLTLVLPGG